MKGWASRKRVALQNWLRCSVNVPFLNGGLFDVHDLETGKSGYSDTRRSV